MATAMQPALNLQYDYLQQQFDSCSRKFNEDLFFINKVFAANRRAQDKGFYNLAEMCNRRQRKIINEMIQIVDDEKAIMRKQEAIYKLMCE